MSLLWQHAEKHEFKPPRRPLHAPSSGHSVLPRNSGVNPTRKIVVAGSPRTHEFSATGSLLQRLQTSTHQEAVNLIIDSNRVPVEKPVVRVKGFRIPSKLPTNLQPSTVKYVQWRGRPSMKTTDSLAFLGFEPFQMHEPHASTSPRLCSGAPLTLKASRDKA